MIIKAIIYAAYKHRGQKRRLSNLPYIVHPLKAGYILYKLGYENKYIVSAILHDVLEDTDTKPDQMCKHFGHEITDIVKQVSNNYKTVSKIEDMSIDAIIIKMADTQSNLDDYYKYGGGVSESKFNSYKANMIKYLDIISKNII